MDISLEEEVPYEWAGNEARCLGNVLHRSFETIVKQGLENWNEKKVDQLKPSLDTALLAEGMSPLNLEVTRRKRIARAEKYLEG